MRAYKNVARSDVHKALRNGDIKKKPCEICGVIQVEAHHNNYSKPLEIIWLCKDHHLMVGMRFTEYELLTLSKHKTIEGIKDFIKENPIMDTEQIDVAIKKRAYIRDSKSKTRIEKIMKMYAEGNTLEQIGNEVGLTRQRVSQIVIKLKAKE